MTNEFELSGRVGYIECKFFENGTVKTDVNIGVKKKESGTDDDEQNWENFFVTFFNTQKRATAEEIAERVRKGDYIRVAGKLSINKYTPEGTDKEVSSIQLIGFGFKKMRFNDFKNRWEDVD